MLERLKPFLTKELLSCLSSLVCLVFVIYVDSSEDLEGTVNDDVFRSERVYPVIESILTILTHVMCCVGYRESVFGSDVVGVTRCVCSGSAVMKPREFLLPGMYGCMIGWIVGRVSRVMRQGSMRFPRSVRTSRHLWGQ